MQRQSISSAWLWELITVLMVAIALGFVAIAVVQELALDMVWDWLRHEYGVILSWWVLTTLAGLSALPLLFRLLPGLPSRGYALARAAGIMLVGFVFWFVGVLGFWPNSPGAILLAWLIVIGFGIFLWRRTEKPFEYEQYLRQNWALIVVVEMLFIALLVGWALYRAHEPEIRSTEKPMEFMFVSSIRQSEFFPPNDGWLSGYSISYYYFGYIITAGLADLSGINTGLAFGMIGPLLFALSGIGILGLVYDLVRASDILDNWMGGSAVSGIWIGLLGTVMLVFMGNLGTFFIEMPWNGKGDLISKPGVDYFEFWDVPERSRITVDRSPLDPEQNWDIPSEGLENLPERPDDRIYTFAPDINANGIPDFEEPSESLHAATGEEIDLSKTYDKWNYWWWFRYSRVINDKYLSGDSIGVQPIAEFPHFSFILGDIHPHVLALPFTLLALTLAAGLALSGRSLEWWGYLLMAIWVGGLVFMNTWDAIFIIFLVGAEALRRLMLSRGWGLSKNDLVSILVFGLVIGGLTILLYLPWQASFTSQASGLYLNVIWPTAPQQLFLQFGTFFVLLAPFLLVEAWWGRLTMNWLHVGIMFMVLFIAIVLLLPAVSALLMDPLCGDGNTTGIRGSACLAEQILLGGEATTREGFWSDLLARRAPSYLSEGIMLGGLVLIGFRLFGRVRPSTIEDDDERQFDTLPLIQRLPYHPATGFVLLALAAGLVLVLVPDFIYLVDNFRVRINTVFKLYYQAWTLFSVAGAYGVYVLLSGLGILWETSRRKSEPDEEISMVYPPRVGWRVVYVMLAIAAVFMGLAYPYYAGRSRSLVETGRFAARNAYETCQDNPEQFTDCGSEFGEALTLDGRRTSLMETSDYQIAQCLLGLNPSQEAVIVEAPFNGGYWAQGVDYSRISMLTGVPTVIGWMNHEGQWRGATYDEVVDTVRDASGAVIDNREIAVDRLYRTEDWAEVQQVLDRYNIAYVMVGHAERVRYVDNPNGLDKFAERYSPVCTAGDSALYQVGG